MFVRHEDDHGSHFDGGEIAAAQSAMTGYEARLWAMADGKPFEHKMRRLVAQLREQHAEGTRLDDAIATNLEALGFGDSGS